MFEAALAMHVSNVSVCQDKLNSWIQAANFDDHDNLKAFQVRCMFDLPKRKCIDGQLTGLVGEVLECGVGHAVDDDTQYKEDLKQTDHLDVRVVDAWLRY